MRWLRVVQGVPSAPFAPQVDAAPSRAIAVQMSATETALMVPSGVSFNDLGLNDS
jgi:hypothetical protein